MVVSVDLEELDLAWSVGTELLTKPMVTKGVLLGARGHSCWFELGKGEGTGVVFMDADMDVGGVQGREGKDGGNLFEDVNDGKEILAYSAEGNVFGLHGGEGDESIEMAPPLDCGQLARVITYPERLRV